MLQCFRDCEESVSDLELWDAYGADGKTVGTDLVRGEPIPEGLYHLVAEVLVRHQDGCYLVTRRCDTLPHAPGLWQTGAGGSVCKGENAFQGALRELQEETGIVSQELSPLYRVRSEEKQTFFVGFLCQTDWPKQDVRLQPGETVEYRWLERTELEALMTSGCFVPGLRQRLAQVWKEV